MGHTRSGLFTEPIRAGPWTATSRSRRGTRTGGCRRSSTCRRRGGALRELVGRLRGRISLTRSRPRCRGRRDHPRRKAAVRVRRRAGDLIAARAAIEGVLGEDGDRASVRISHWDDVLEKRRRSTRHRRPRSGEREAAAERDANAVETRTLVVSSGRMIRAEFEQSIREWADSCSSACAIVEHPHLSNDAARVHRHGAEAQDRRVLTGPGRRGARDYPHRDGGHVQPAVGARRRTSAQQARARIVHSDAACVGGCDCKDRRALGVMSRPQ